MPSGLKTGSRSHPRLPVSVLDGTVSSTVPGLNPTRAKCHVDILHSEDRHPYLDPSLDQDTTETQKYPGNVPQVYWHWTTRNSRKGRHHLVIHRPKQAALTDLPRSTSDISEITGIIWKMATYYPYWDVSWLVAVFFTVGSVVWVINGFFAWLPLIDPASQFTNETLYGGGISAFIGATIFEAGSIFLILEAINEDRSSNFGWAISHEAAAEHSVLRFTKLHNVSNSLRTDKWQWVPTWYDLKNHYISEIGFLASASQLLAATVFWISGFTALPGISNHMSQGLTDGVYWVPQVVGGCGFIVSSFLFMLETQKKWYLPALTVLGWHIGAWNLIGAVGFTLCGASGMAYKSSGAAYQASLATFWGSWAFLIGSVIQWYESLDKHPVSTTTKSRDSSERSLA